MNCFSADNPQSPDRIATVQGTPEQIQHVEATIRDIIQQVPLSSSQYSIYVVVYVVPMLYVLVYSYFKKVEGA